MGHICPDGIERVKQCKIDSRINGAIVVLFMHAENKNKKQQRTENLQKKSNKSPQRRQTTSSLLVDTLVFGLFKIL